MTTKLRLFAVLVLALTIGVVSLVPAATGDKRQGKHGKHVKVLKLTTQTVQEAELDLGEPGFGVGDRFVFSDNVFRGDRQVGILGGECTFVRLEPSPLPEGQEPTAAVVNCVATIQLRKGQLTAQGLVSFSEQSGDRFTIAITGGTGAYRTAHGEATITTSEDEDGPQQLKLKIIR